ncbi:CDP-diacylglycerol--serine O-phosphatidyltransferase [Aliikangiella sp. IMCC44653]
MKLTNKNKPLNCGLNSIPIAAEKIEIIETPKEFADKLMALIANAKERIYITALYLQDDTAGKEILEAIYQAKQAKPNLDVKIFVDYLRAQRGLMGQAKSIGNVRLYRELANKYEHQIDILGVPVKTKEVLGVLHLKGFIFDDTLLYSGASINNVYLQQEQRYRYDRYHLIHDKTLTNSMVNYLNSYLANAKAVKSLTAKSLPDKTQLKQVIKQLKNSLRQVNYTVPTAKAKQNDGEVLVTPLLGFGGRKNMLNNSIYELVKQTEKKLTIFTPYFNLPNKINKAVRRSLKQGKEVEIVVGDKTANDFFIPVEQEFNRIGIVPYVYETNLRKFVKRNQKFIDSGLLNVRLWKDGENSFHLKGISCDEKNHLITGHNLNPRACRLDLENGILIEDSNKLLAQKFAHELATILTHTTRLEHFNQVETIKDYPAAASKLMRSVKRAKLDSILNRLL